MCGLFELSPLLERRTERLQLVVGDQLLASHHDQASSGRGQPQGIEDAERVLIPLPRQRLQPSELLGGRHGLVATDAHWGVETLKVVADTRRLAADIERGLRCAVHLQGLEPRLDDQLHRRERWILECRALELG